MESLGEVMVEGGASEPFSVDLPEDVLSLTVLLIEPGERSLLAVTHLTGPDGQRLVDPMPPGYEPSPRDQLVGPFPGAFHSPNRVAPTAIGFGGMLAPNNPDVALTPGEWTLRIGGAGAQSGQPAVTVVEVITVIKRGPRLPGCGRLPVHLFFTGARGWTADTGPDDPDLQQAINRMRSAYAGVGISLGPITYDDVDAPQMVDATGGPGSELHALFALNTYPTGVGVFFVDRLTSPFGGGIGGVSGGVPGPTLHPETPHSGVVVATAIEPSPEAIGRVMAHEAGHFLGLFHTVEFTGLVDQIEDTPEGPADTSNLMFPTVRDDDVQLSPGQGWVLQHNASIEAPEEE